MFHLSRRLNGTDLKANNENTMPQKADKPTQNSALQGISKQGNLMIKVLFICHGNICRSTMAESVFTYMVNRANLEALFEIDSAATSREEIGNEPHYGTVRRLGQAGLPVVPHRARQMTREDYLHFDYLIGMDSANIRNMTRIAGGSDEAGKIYKMLSFADYDKNRKLKEARDVADPWYTGDFEAAYQDIVAGCEGLLAYLLCEK